MQTNAIICEKEFAFVARNRFFCSSSHASLGIGSESVHDHHDFGVLNSVNININILFDEFQENQTLIMLHLLLLLYHEQTCLLHKFGFFMA